MKNFIFLCLATFMIACGACTKNEVMTPDIVKPGGTEVKAVGVTSVAYSIIQEATCPGNGICYQQPDPQTWAIYADPLLTFLEDDNNVPSYAAAEAYLKAHFYFNPDGSPLDGVVHLYYEVDSKNPSLDSTGTPFHIQIYYDGKSDISFTSFTP